MEIDDLDTDKDDLDNEPKSDLLDISNTLVNSMPVVNENAVSKLNEEKADTEHALANPTDENGNPRLDVNGETFDKARHKTKKDGSASISSKGKLMLKPKSQVTINTNPVDSISEDKLNSCQVEKPQLSAQETQKCHALGSVSAHTLFSLGRMLGGDEWAPTKMGEHDESAAMTEAFANYYIACGTTEISPTLGLTIAIGSYAAPRFTQPTTQKRAKTFGARVFGWWNKRKGANQERKRAVSETARKNAEKTET